MFSEVHSLVLAGLTDKGLQFDIQHMDGETERLILGGDPYGMLSLGMLDGRIARLRITGGFTAVLPITKEEFRSRIGCGMLLDKQHGHLIAT